MKQSQSAGLAFVVLALGLGPSAELSAQPALREIWVSSGVESPVGPWESIKDAWIDAERIYVLDRGARRVVVLDNDGAVVGSMGRTGRGPGEFVDPTDVVVFAGRVRVEDGGNLRVSIFDSEEYGHIETRRHRELPVPRVAWSRPLRDGRAVFMSSTFVNREGQGLSRILIVGSGRTEELAVFERLGATILYEGESRLSLGPAPAGPSGAAVVLGDSLVVVLDGMRGSIEVTRADGVAGQAAARSLDLPYGAESVSARSRELLIELGVGDIIDDPRTSDPRAPNALSGWTALEAGARSTVWARRGGAAAIQGRREEWWRFDLRRVGEPLVLRLPAGLRAIHFGDGVLVGVRQSALGEDRLVLLRWSE
ncbi:MAG: 6-bladed beta-propeller [Longimicrobiales bacterium]